MMGRIAAGILALAGIMAGCANDVGRVPTGVLGRIRDQDIHRDLFFLASDSMSGRNTPSPELDIAAAYIAAAFERNHLLPVNGIYFQPFPLHIVALGNPNKLEVRSSRGDRTFEIKTDFMPFEMTANREVRGTVVFVGYGITAPEFKYDDYDGIDVTGKIVFVLRHEPGEEDSTSVFDGRKATDYSNVGTKARIALEHGAIGMMVATDPLNHTSLTPRGFPWPSLSKFIPADALPLTLGTNEDSKLPVVHVGESVIALLFGSVDTLKEIQAEIDRKVVPRSFPITGTHADIQTSTSIRVMSAKNVVGVLPGADPALRGETVIVGAHYDHLGQKKDHAPGERYIYNGADDNASGTCALLAVAAALGGVRTPPRRTILCIAFAGEEKGLFGSEYYTKHPLFPLTSTVAMLNMDMVGRNSPDTLFMIGSDSSPDLARIARVEDDRVGFVLVDQKLVGGGSDHMSFMKKKIPDLFFHSGTEGEYHTVNDRPELIDIQKVARVAGLAFYTVFHCANDTAHYQYIPKPFSLF